ncbi:MAG: O-antigen ligase family protein [Leptospira sp.]|nr:O-antigen ligase family protein [Leptospira sp.]
MLYRAYVFFVCLSIISCAISVSLSQLFLFLAFITFWFQKDKPNYRSPILLILILFYGWQLSSFLYHQIANGFDREILILAWKGELKDMILLSAFFLVQGIKKEDRDKVTKAFIVFSFLILISGLVSVFSPIRLSRLISDLYKTSATWPYQHHYGSFLKTNLYLPIGLMNTHLTFGGLLSFVYPYFFFSAYDKWKSNAPKYIKVLYYFALIMISFVFLLNSARSAMLGSLFSVMLGIYILVFLEKEFSGKLIKRLGISLLVIIILLGISYSQSKAIQKVIQPLFGSEKHTDSGRTFIWDSTFPLILKNPIFGIGPGAYPKEIEVSRKVKEIEHPELAYFYEVTQRGHSHNDFFHQATIFGLPALTLYCLLGLNIVYGFVMQKVTKQAMYITLGLTGFYLSGLLQCYFQDDEVLIVFFFLLGYYQMFYKKDEITV